MSSKEYREKNREKLRINQKKYNRAHRKERKDYYLSHKEEARLYRKEYSRKHKESELAYARRYSQYFPEKVKKSQEKYRKNHKRRIKISQKEYRQTHFEEKREYHKDYAQTPRGRFKYYKSGAKRRNLEWALTYEQFMSFWQKKCGYCGEKIKTIGLDRTRNDEGYLVDNVEPCCTMCNRMKLDHSSEKFVLHCLKIINNLTIKI